MEAQICRLYTEDGLSTGMIAERLVTSGAVVRNVLARHGVPLDPARRGFRVMSPEQRSAIATQGGAAVPGDKRMFARDRTLAVESGRKARMLEKLRRESRGED